MIARRRVLALLLYLDGVGIALLMGSASGHQNLIALICMAFIFLFRAAAIRWKLEVPDWLRMADHKSKG
jgi:uncharacterized membrane protein YeiH